MIKSRIDKMENTVKGASRNPFWEFLEPAYISGTVKARNFKVCIILNTRSNNDKMQYNVKLGREEVK